MFLQQAAVVFAGLLSIQQASAQRLDKPLIQPAFGSLNQGLWDHLNPTQSTNTLWGWGWLPNRCKMEAEEFGLSPYDMEVFNVKYNDCGDSWVMCRHNKSPLSRNDIIDLFGRLPVHSRQYVRHVIVLPMANAWARTWWTWGDMCIYGAAKSPTLWTHEIAHAVDMLKQIGSNPRPFSSSSAWKAAYDRDTAISDDYAQTSQTENFAQEYVISLWDKVVPGGIGIVQPSWSKIYNMYSTIQAQFGSSLVPGGQCYSRITNDYNVCMGPAAGCATSRVAPPTTKTDASIPRLALPALPEGFPENTGNLTSGAHSH